MKIASPNNKLPLIAIFFLLQPLYAQEILLPSITTYIDDTVVEQKTVITADEIQEKHVDSLTGLLQSEGIQILAYGAYGLQQAPSIRGFTDETVRVVIDGVCVNNAQYGTFDFSSINIADIEKIEIVRGGFTEGVCDEGAVGGVIYITTRKQQFGTHFNSDSQIKTFFNANMPFDTFSQNLGFSSSVGKSSFFKAGAKGVWANNRSLFENYRGLRLERQNSEVKDANANIQFLHYFGNGNYFNVSDLFYIGNKNVPGVENAAYSGVQDDLSNKAIF
nr:TonB-dependent receptor plug domain-containing protein [Treponema sp.]